MSGWERLTRALPALLLAGVLLLGLVLRAGNIERTLPYCQHVDEKTWIEIAWRMMREHDPNPGRFTKPSLPVYVLVAVSRAALKVEKAAGRAYHVRDLGVRAYPYYQLPSAVLTAKELFTTASLLALLCLGLVAQRLGEDRALLPLVPGLAFVSSSYFELSWEYINVDTLGSLFVWATTAHLLAWHTRKLRGGGPRWQRLADLLAAGVLCGATIGCKYNLFPIAVPAALVLVFQGRARLLPRLCLLGGATLATFFVTTPFALLDRRTFLADVKREIQHYGGAQANLPEPRTLDAASTYAAELWQNWGLLLLLAGFGLWGLARKKPQELALVFAFPVLFFGYMSAQSLAFERNIMSLHLHVALAVAFGARGLVSLVEPVLARLWVAASVWRQRSAAVVSAALVLAAVPWRSVTETYGPQADSRNLAADWVKAHLEPSSKLWVDPRLYMDTRELAETYGVESLELDRKGRVGQTPTREPGSFAIVAAESLNGADAQRLPVVTRFGTSGLRTSRALLGDPKLAIVRF